MYYFGVCGCDGIVFCFVCGVGCNRDLLFFGGFVGDVGWVFFGNVVFILFCDNYGGVVGVE